jgi:hypothetical protein
VLLYDPPPPRPVAATVSVDVPAVAVPTSDGLPRSLHAGRVRVDLPVLLTVPGETRVAWLEVNGVAGPVVPLHQGVSERVTATSVARAGTRVSVRVVVDGAVLTAWQHPVAR